MPMSPELEAVHRLIVECHREYFEESPSPAKVQKLCYYAQAFSLARGQDLFPEDFEAWQSGPGIPSLYAKYKDLQWRAIETEWSTPLEEAEGFDTVREVVAAYGRYDASALSTMSHRQTPWIDARKGIAENEGSREVINKASMRRSMLRSQSDEE